MADDVRVTNWPSDGSRERVAFDLYLRVAHGAKLELKSGGAHAEQQLKLFMACRNAVFGSDSDWSKIS